MAIHRLSNSLLPGCVIAVILCIVLTARYQVKITVRIIPMSALLSSKDGISNFLVINLQRVKQDEIKDITTVKPVAVATTSKHTVVLEIAIDVQSLKRV